MDWSDVGPLIGLYMGAFALGWSAGWLYLAFKRVAEVTT